VGHDFMQLPHLMHSVPNVEGSIDPGGRIHPSLKCGLLIPESIAPPASPAPAAIKYLLAGR